MNVMPITEYNAIQTDKYSKACKEWDFSKGGFPQVAFYLFYDEQGNQRNEGFVAVSEDWKKHIYAPTEIGAKRRYNKFAKRGY
jgi:hypothetical protein